MLSTGWIKQLPSMRYTSFKLGFVTILTNLYEGWNYLRNTDPALDCYCLAV
jgi:hypothetical protein